MSLRMRFLMLVVGAMAAGYARPARGVILYSTPTRNGTPDSGSIAYSAWQLEGQFGGFLGTPIAGQYFVTAAHPLGDRLRILAGQDPWPNLSTSTITYQGQSYNIDTSYAHGGVQFDPNSDLAILKVQQTFPTFAHLYTTADETGKQMVVIGRGTQRGGDVVVNGQAQGWYWGTADGVQSWGQNTVSGVVPQGAGWGDSLAFAFDATNPTACTLSPGDSGGGVFIQSGGEWKLAGINLGVDGHYSFVGSSSDSFDAAMFDKRGLYEGSGSNWTLNDGPDPIPASAYATRISSNLAFIDSAIPEPGTLLVLLPAMACLMLRRR